MEGINTPDGIAIVGVFKTQNDTEKIFAVTAHRTSCAANQARRCDCGAQERRMDQTEFRQWANHAANRRTIRTIAAGRIADKQKRETSPRKLPTRPGKVR